MKDKTTMREVMTEDHEHLVKIALAAWTPVFASFERILGPEIFALAYPDWKEDKKKQILWACRPDTPGTVLVAERDGVVVGFVSFFVSAQHSSIAEIGNNAVHPDYQRQGIAQLMYKEAFRRLRAQGVEVVEVTTGGDPSHLPARRAYEKAGFNASLPGVHFFRQI